MAKFEVFNLCTVFNLFLLTKNFASSHTDQLQPNAYSSLGRGYYLPDLNLAGEFITGGYPVFTDLSSACVESTNLKKNESKEYFFEDTESFYSHLAYDVSLSYDLMTDFTLGMTLLAVSNGIGGVNNTVSGYTYYSSARTFEITFNSSFTNDRLNHWLREDFESLPAKIEKPWLRESWDAHLLFLMKYGTHVITNIEYGSSLYMTVFANTNSRYSGVGLAYKTCGELGGPNINASVCSGVSQAEIDSTSYMDVSSVFIARGGTTETRAELLAHRSDELIKKFLAEADVTQQPIHYRFTPIWNFLKKIYPAKSAPVHYSKAIQLEAFFKGYLNYGCEYRCQYWNQKVTIELQKFSYSNTTPPYLECSLAPKGCRTNDDCHYRNVGWCECRGCVRYYEEKLNTGRMKEYAVVYNGSSYKYPGCKISGWGTSCACKKHILERDIVWKLE